MLSPIEHCAHPWPLALAVPSHDRLKFSKSGHELVGADLNICPPRPPLAVTSRVMTVTVRPPTQPPAEPLITVELSYIINVSEGPDGDPSYLPT